MINSGDFISIDFIKNYIHPLCDCSRLTFILLEFVTKFLSVSFEACAPFGTELRSEISSIVQQLINSVLEYNNYEDAEQAWACLSWLVKFNIYVDVEDVI